MTDFFPDSNKIIPLFNNDFDKDTLRYKGELDLSNKRVCILFFAPWCGHCKMFKQKYSKLAELLYDLRTDIVFASFDCDFNKSKITQLLGIRGFPTIILFENGNMTKTYIGDRSIESLINFVKK